MQSSQCAHNTFILRHLTSGIRTPYVGVAGNYSPHQTSQYFRTEDELCLANGIGTIYMNQPSPTTVLLQAEYQRALRYKARS